MAPEEDFKFKFIKEMKNNLDIVLSMGHSNGYCTYCIDMNSCSLLSWYGNKFYQ